MRTLAEVKADLSDNPPIPCEFKVGDKVTYTNDYGIKFKGFTIFGFVAKADYVGDDFYTAKKRFIHIVNETGQNAYWFPHSAEELTKE